MESVYRFVIKINNSTIVFQIAKLQIVTVVYLINRACLGMLGVIIMTVIILTLI